MRILPATQVIWFLSQLLKSSSYTVKAARKQKKNKTKQNINERGSLFSNKTLFIKIGVELDLVLGP